MGKIYKKEEWAKWITDWCFFIALRATIIEGKGDFSESRLAEYQGVMRNLWNELSDLADFDKVRIVLFMKLNLLKYLLLKLFTLILKQIYNQKSFSSNFFYEKPKAR